MGPLRKRYLSTSTLDETKKPESKICKQNLYKDCILFSLSNVYEYKMSKKNQCAHTKNKLRSSILDRKLVENRYIGNDRTKADNQLVSVKISIEWLFNQSYF